MEKTVSLLAGSCILFSFLSCVQPVMGEKVYLFDPGAENLTMNMSLSGIMWSTSYCEGEKNKVPVHHGDLLHIYFSDAGTLPLVLHYDEKDETHGQFSFEKKDEYTYLYKMNDSVIQLNLFNVSEAWQWLENAQPEDLKTIRSLLFFGDIDSSPSYLLEKIAAVNNNPGLYFENSAQLLKVLPMFQPDCMIMGNWDPVDKEAAEEVYALLQNQKNLKKVYFTTKGGDPEQNYRFLASLPALQTIMIPPSLFNQITAASLPECLRNLEELILFSSNKMEVSDVSILKELSNIRKVRCIMTMLSGDIEDLYSLPRLTSLSFTGTEVENVPGIKEIPGIKWFSFPKNTDQAYFQAFCEKNPGVEYLELVSCKNITDVSPLLWLKQIKGLILIDMKIEDYSPLYTLKGLEFLILPSILFKKGNDAEIEELKNNLPDSSIMCGEPFCLGSGWILLFPFIIILCLIVIKGLNNYRIHNKKRH
ncbi:MAG: hypothetical protein JXB88_24955 [Spirochaetales bacterium]|nr:hypothetical protein [Spirochaetales bacterium]